MLETYENWLGLVNCCTTRLTNICVLDINRKWLWGWYFLGWLYVFSSFLPCPLLQKLLPLMSKLFELNLRYLAQRIYGSGEMYWMTFPWPWPKVLVNFLQSFRMCIFKVKHYLAISQDWLVRLMWNEKEVHRWILRTICDLTLGLTPDIDPGCFKVKFRNSSFSGIFGLIDVKWKQSELIWYWADCVTLPFDHTHDLDLGVEIWRSESEIALSQELDGRLTWNEKDASYPFMTMILTSVTISLHGGVGGCTR